MRIFKSQDSLLSEGELSWDLLCRCNSRLVNKSDQSSGFDLLTRLSPFFCESEKSSGSLRSLAHSPGSSIPAPSILRPQTRVTSSTQQTAINLIRQSGAMPGEKMHQASSKREIAAVTEARRKSVPTSTILESFSSLVASSTQQTFDRHRIRQSMSIKNDLSLVQGWLRRRRD